MKRLCAVLVAPLSLVLFASIAHALTPGLHVVISEVQTRGSAGAGDEFVELLNPTCASVDISGWTLAFRSSTGISYVTRATIPASTVLAPGQHYLVVGSAFSGTATPDLVLVSGIPDAGVLKLSTAVGDIIDGLGFYYDATTLAAVENFNLGGMPASNLPHDNTNNGSSNTDASLLRKNSGTTNTSDNASDFDAGSVPNPESSVSADVALDCGTGVGDIGTPRQLAFSVTGRNPFRGSTTLSCALPHAARVRIDVYSVDGRRRATLADRNMGAGWHVVLLELKGAGGPNLAPGVYLVRLTADGEQRSVRVIGLN